MLDRRSVMLAAPAALAFAAVPARADDDEIAALERVQGGRLGVAALDTQTGATLLHRAGERFAMCSTFKVLLAAAVLHRVDAGAESLARAISYGPADMLSHAPATRDHLAQGHMTVEALCEAAVTVSDNTAANLLIASLGGPQHVTAFARMLGDAVTHLDRREPALNFVAPGEKRDSTTPAAMMDDWRKLFLTPILSEASRKRLTEWTQRCLTGNTRLRAGLPGDWIVGDKTGSGFAGETNDIAIAWRPKRAPVLIAAYYAGSPDPRADRDSVLAAVGRIVGARFS